MAFFEDFSETINSRRGKEYLERCKEGDQSARDMLIEHICVWCPCGKKYQGSDYDMEDLLSVGTIGLLRQ